MSWDGINRRKSMEQPKYCEAHIAFAEKLTQIFTTVVNIEKTLADDAGFKRGVFLALMSIVLIIVIQVASFSFLFGQMSRQVSINTGRLDVVEAQHIKILNGNVPR